MCVSAVAYAVLAASAVSSAYSSYEQGRQQAANANYQAQLADVQAAEARSSAQAAAAKTRQDASRYRSAAKANFAYSGVDAEAGTPIFIDQDITARGEEDALTQILQGDSRARSFETEAQYQRAMSKQARRKGNIGVGVSLFRSAATAYTLGALGGSQIVGYDSSGAAVTRNGTLIH